MKKFIIMIFVAVILTSCEKEVKIKLPEQPVAMVVNAFLSPNDSITVYLTSTRSPFDQFEHYIDDALLIISCDTISDTLRYLDEGLYKSNIVGQSGLSYTLKAIHKDFENVLTTDYIPKLSPSIEITDYTDAVGLDEEGISISKLDVYIQDDPLENNFYEIYLENIYYDYFGNIDDIFYSTCYSNDNFVNNGLSKQVVFSDKLFNGKKQKIEVLFYPRGPENKKYDVIVHIRSLSENYFKYRMKKTAHTLGQESSFWLDETSMPVQMFSNVDGGYGVFIGYSQYVDTVSNIDNYLKSNNR